jgi:hypothetical protein
MPALANSRNGEKLRIADDLLIKHSQWLLKSEWEKVKSETRGFVLKRWVRSKRAAIFTAIVSFVKMLAVLARFDPTRSVIAPGWHLCRVRSRHSV